jgi:hypothetical protein
MFSQNFILASAGAVIAFLLVVISIERTRVKILKKRAAEYEGYFVNKYYKKKLAMMREMITKIAAHFQCINQPLTYSSVEKLREGAVIALDKAIEKRDIRILETNESFQCMMLSSHEKMPSKYILDAFRSAISYSHNELKRTHNLDEFVGEQETCVKMLTDVLKQIP